MPMLRFPILIILHVLLLANMASALRCGNNLVATGDRKTEVIQKCGKPFSVEEWTEKVVFYKSGEDATLKKVRPDSDHLTTSRVIHSNLEEWTYNFGSNKFIYFLTFTNGKLTDIEEGSWGFDAKIRTRPDKVRCGSIVEAGDKKIDVIQKCGEPTSVDKRNHERVHNSSRKGKNNSYDDDETAGREFYLKNEKSYKRLKTDVNIEEWAYNFGPNYFQYFMKFENGTLVTIEQGDYGY